MKPQVVVVIPPSPSPSASTNLHQPLTSATLLENKTTFLRQQTRLLSAPLRVSSTWQTDEARIPDSVVADVTEKVNRRLTQHAKRVYGTQSLRHVAEQIDALYFRDVVGLAIDARDTSVRRTTELSGLEDREAVLGVLGDELVGGIDEVRRYEMLREKLAGLVERRNQLRGQVQQTEKLGEIVAPFENPSVSVQGNLVGRDGELQNELRRMRVLMARVSQKLGELQQVDEGRDAE